MVEPRIYISGATFITNKELVKWLKSWHVTLMSRFQSTSV